jgi:outer membrane protein assembly factor BamE
MITSAYAFPGRRGIAGGLLAAVAALGATGCGVAPTLDRDRLVAAVTPYRIEIVQGNAITREQVAQARPGMTRLQVRDVLGSPMLSDPFHADRWDYIFTIRRPGTAAQRRHVVAYFEGDTLQRLDAPADLPSENEFVASIDPGLRQTGPARRLELNEAERAALPQPATRPSAGAEPPAAPPRAYPPLER